LDFSFNLTKEADLHHVCIRVITQKSPIFC